LVFEPRHGYAGKARSMPDRLRRSMELAVANRAFAKMFLWQDQETMIRQAEGLKYAD
jgi:hypothetical protein